jgi:hypothetical protein
MSIKDNEMQASQGFGRALVVACQSPEPVKPGEAVLDYPAAGQQRETFLCLRQFDDLQLHTFIASGLRRRSPVLTCPLG